MQTTNSNIQSSHVSVVDEIIQDTEAFRDAIGTVDASGKRKWIYPRKQKGRFYRARTMVSYILLSLMFAGPFLTWNGYPLFLFNILERKFIIFGIPFWPQDFHLFVLAMISFFMFIVLFTVMLGRLWCGWACPQTVFMEMVFRKIEYWIEGDATQQRKLNQAPWTSEKIAKKAAKLGIFFFISFLIGNLVMAYMVGVERLSDMVTHPPADNWSLFTGVFAFSAIFFFVFSYFREQACLVVCPYGRLQSVLLGKDSIVVAYDWIRGEPRGRIRKNESENTKGDCIDCKLCVQVCPTGIDIRDGTQMECINCTSCIDACDHVMDKIKRPRGLIRFASFSQIEMKQPFKLTTRIIAYSVVLMLLLSILSFSLLSRQEVEATILRTPGMLFQKTDDGNISNLYNVQVVNKTHEEMPIELRLMEEEAEEGTLTLVGKPLTLADQDIAKGAFFVELPPSALDGPKTRIRIGVYSHGELVDQVTTNFLGPVN